MYILQRVLRANIDGTGFNQEQEHEYSIVRYIPLVRPAPVSPSPFTPPLSLPHHSHCPCLSLTIHTAPVSTSPFPPPLSLPRHSHCHCLSLTIHTAPVSPSPFTPPLSLPHYSHRPCLSLTIHTAPVSPSPFTPPLSLPHHSHCPCPHPPPSLYASVINHMYTHSDTHT